MLETSLATLRAMRKAKYQGRVLDTAGSFARALLGESFNKCDVIVPQRFVVGELASVVLLQFRCCGGETRLLEVGAT